MEYTHSLEKINLEQYFLIQVQSDCLQLILQDRHLQLLLLNQILQPDLLALILQLHLEDRSPLTQLTLLCFDLLSHPENFNLNLALTNLVNQFQRDLKATRQRNRLFDIQMKLDLSTIPLQTSHQIYCIVKEALSS